MNVFILDKDECISVVTVALNQILQQPIIFVSANESFVQLFAHCGYMYYRA